MRFGRARWVLRGGRAGCSVLVMRWGTAPRRCRALAVAVVATSGTARRTPPLPAFCAQILRANAGPLSPDCSASLRAGRARWAVALLGHRSASLSGLRGRGGGHVGHGPPYTTPASVFAPNFGAKRLPACARLLRVAPRCVGALGGRADYSRVRGRYAAAALRPPLARLLASLV